MTYALTIDRSIGSYLLSLKAANRSKNTVTIYGRMLRRFAKWMQEQGVTNVADVERRHLRDYLNRLHDRELAPATVSQRRSILIGWGKWLEAEDEVDKSPARGLPKVTVPDQPMPIPTDDEVEALLAVCKGRDFDSRRDTAIVRLLMATGLRRSEAGNLTLDDLDMETRSVTVMGKGRRERAVTFDHQTAVALDRYLRIRDRHPHHTSRRLWLGRRGPLAPDSVYDVLKRRGRQAGVPIYNPHAFRHYFVDRGLARGMQDSSLVFFAGWSNPTMLHRYGRANRGRRAKEDYDKAFGTG